MGIAAHRRRNDESRFERLGVDGSDTEQYQVSAFHSSLDGWSEALKPGESLDDLNYLAALLTQRSNEERDKFAAAAQYGDHAASAADLINLTHNLDCYWLYPTVHNSDDYGHYLIDDLDELELPDAAKRFFDYKSYGREAVKEDRGILPIMAMSTITATIMRSGTKPTKCRRNIV